MKVLFQAFSIDKHTGINVYSRNLINALAELGTDSILYTAFNQKSRLQKVITSKNTCIKNTYPHPRALGKGFEPKITALINSNFISNSKKHGNIAHFLHPHYYHQNLSSCAVTIHDLFQFYDEDWANIAYGVKRKELQELVAKIAMQAGQIFVPSQSAKDDILKFISEKIESKIHVTHLAANDEYKLLDKNHCNLEKFGIANSCKYFLFVSQFNPRKNAESLIQAYATLNNSILDEYKLVFVGDGSHSQRESIFAALKQNGIEKSFIHIKNPTNAELNILYNRAASLVFPSFGEGFGLPIVEAMSAGCPVITSAGSSTGEIAGVAGLLINPMDTDSIKSAMEQIAENNLLREELIAKGLLRASEFSWTKTAQKHIKGYERLLK